MAAFCACCGAEITLRAEACPVCKTPRHGMAPPRGVVAPRNLADPIELTGADLAGADRPASDLAGSDLAASDFSRADRSVNHKPGS